MVLIVDDDVNVREAYIPYFLKKGYRAVGASNGDDALRVLADQKVDLVILDLNMPGMPGEDVMARMADDVRSKNIPIIIDSALSPASERVKSIWKRFEGKLRFDFFQRPTSLEKLNEAIYQILII